jgi:hypothetical protein
MKLTALCPTYRRPELLANSLALWQRQTYTDCRLIILDDGGSFAPERGPNWELVGVPDRYPSLPAKYNALLALAPDSDAYLVWEDDDIYLPEYVALHAACLEQHELSKPTQIWSDYTGRPAIESAAGRFHSTLGFRRSLIERLGGWPDTRRADFDLQLIAALEREAKSIGDPGNAFCYGWHTGQQHGQSTMRAADDETWYDRYQMPPAPAGPLVAKLDGRSERILAALRPIIPFGPPDRLIDALTLHGPSLDGLQVVTAADAPFFPAAQMLAASLRLTHGAPLKVFDLGLTAAQRDWFRRHGDEVLAPPPLIMPRSADKWQIWNKPAYLRSLTGKNLWIDADALIVGDLRPARDWIDQRPLITLDTYAQHRAPWQARWWVHNEPCLYDLHPVPARKTELVNAGVFGFDAIRDRPLLDQWCAAVGMAARDARLTKWFHCYDPGALIWALEKMGLADLPAATTTFNDQTSLTGPRTLQELPEALDALRRSPAPPPLIVHFAGPDKPHLAWPADCLPAEDRQTRPDLTLCILGHQRIACPPFPNAAAPHIRPIHLPDIDPSNDQAESRFFHTDLPKTEYIGLCTQSWNKKYAGHCWPLERLHRLPLSPSVVWCAARVEGDWPELSEQYHPGITPVLREVAALAGIDDYRRPAFWSNNFLAHRPIAQDLAAFHRRMLPEILARFGRLPPYDTSRQDGDVRKLSYLMERVTMLWFAARPYLELRQIPA